MAADKLKHNTGLLYGMNMSKKAKETLRNFAEDFGIPNVPRDEHFVLPLAVITKIDPNRDPVEVQEFFTGPVYLSDFSLSYEQVDGRNVLLVDYESMIFDKIYESIEFTYSELDQKEKEFDFILSHDAPGDLDLDQMTFELNNYLTYITGDEDISGFYSLDDIDLMMLGDDQVDDQGDG